MGLSTVQWNSLVWLEAHAAVKLPGRNKTAPGGDVHADDSELRQGSDGVDHEADRNVDTPAESAQRNTLDVCTSLASSDHDGRGVLGEAKDSNEGATRGDQNLEPVWLRMDKVERQICQTIVDKRSLDLQVRHAKRRFWSTGAIYSVL